MVDPAVQPGGGEHHLEPDDEVGGPGLSLPQVIHRNDRPLHEDGHLITELRAVDLIRPLAGFHRRPDHLGFPEGRLGLGDAAERIAVDAEQSLDPGPAEPRAHRALEEVGVWQLLVADQVVGKRRGRSGGLADQHQQVDRHPGSLCELREGDVAQRREAFEGGRIEEVERELAAPDRRAQAVERDSRLDKAADHADATNGPGREAAVRTRADDPRLDQPRQLLGVDTGPLCGLGKFVPVHGP